MALEDGTIVTADTISTLEEPDKSKIEAIYANWLNANKHYERDWRNFELTACDWMLVADATHGGEPIAGSQKLDDILLYRSELRGYDLTKDNRPVRPEWYV
ncbi:hypothetical protein JCM19235_1233 [Vibrio maritimus]|uniref:Uncharacterized protein n=1 Tax=Vibrio maritimus TaxID=990268 RepID=A0A090SUC9_9VIBR|nr:hypothetical protein JCM19235_1233 [Vibrio maritimus]